jgi:hypothetical protein
MRFDASQKRSIYRSGAVLGLNFVITVIDLHSLFADCAIQITSARPRAFADHLVTITVEPCQAAGY